MENLGGRGGWVWSQNYRVHAEEIWGVLVWTASRARWKVGAEDLKDIGMRME